MSKAMKLDDGIEAGRLKLMRKNILVATDFRFLLREIRITGEYTLRGFADEIGFSASYISDVERGARKPSLLLVTSLCLLLETTRKQEIHMNTLAAQAYGWYLGVDQ